MLYYTYTQTPNVHKSNRLINYDFADVKWRMMVVGQQNVNPNGSLRYIISGVTQLAAEYPLSLTVGEQNNVDVLLRVPRKTSNMAFYGVLMTMLSCGFL